MREVMMRRFKMTVDGEEYVLIIDPDTGYLQDVSKPSVACLADPAGWDHDAVWEELSRMSYRIYDSAKEWREDLENQRLR